MQLNELKTKLPTQIIDVLTKENITELRPSQEKAINAGLLEGKNLLVCTPTASGKTIVAEFAATKTIIKQGKKAVYIVPLVALANEKAKEFKRKYSHLFKIALSIGDMDSSETKLGNYNFIICTAEKLDSITRHKTQWLNEIGVVIIDEIHLLNDVSRGPTLEVLITLLKQIIPKAQFIGLSATIGNPHELAEWLKAELVIDTWRPVPLHKGVYYDGQISFQD
ncbi:DEAD/DEAH box helicase [Candidatus Woesearchaeota archaeon]|nr:DEAD/DEAH box helicase [Candidatus Woesearchaeota archaeon]